MRYFGNTELKWVKFACVIDSLSVDYQWLRSVSSDCINPSRAIQSAMRYLGHLVDEIDLCLSLRTTQQFRSIYLGVGTFPASRRVFGRIKIGALGPNETEFLNAELTAWT